VHFDRNRLQTLSETVSVETALWREWEKKAKIIHTGFSEKTLTVKMPTSNHLAVLAVLIL